MADQDQKQNGDPGKKISIGNIKLDKNIASGDALFWGVLAVMLVFHLWPLAVVFGVLRVSGNEWLQRVLDKLNKKHTSPDTAKRTGASVVQMEKTAENEYTVSDRAELREFGDVKEREADRPERQQAPAREKNASSQNASARNKKDVSAGNIRKAKLLQAIGIVLAVGGVAMASSAVGDIISIGWYGAMFKSVWNAACMLGGGALLHTSGTAIKKRERRFKQYLAVIGNRKYVNISDLAKVSSATHHRVYMDLEKMMELGMLPPSAYIDRGLDYLVIDPEALEQERREETARKQAAAVQSGLQDRSGAMAAKRAAEELTEDEKTLQEIRSLNDAIADEVMSEKIDKIENITRAIFALIRKNPERRQEVRSFFSYYLPTTLKLLSFYAQLEDQPIQGATILESRQNIESIMDTLIRGYEAQLDSLFRTEALDISSDIRVLETMLAQDGIDNSEQWDAIARIMRAAQREPPRAADSRELTASVPKLF